MEITSPSSATYAAIAATASVRPPAPPVMVEAPGRPAAPAGLSAVVPGATPSAPVRLSPLGQVAGAVGALLSSASVASVVAAAQSATRIAQAIAALDQSIAGLARIDEGTDDERDFLSSAQFSQRLLATGLTDSVNGRATGDSLAALGLRPLPGGAFNVDRGTLEQALRADPTGVIALITDYARNLDGFFAQRAGTRIDRSALEASSLLAAGAPGSLADFATRQALAAFRANALP
jgi:hypothetical protein